MNNGLIIITMLTLCNFLIFIALVAIIIKAGARERKSSFRQINSTTKTPDSLQTAVIDKIQIKTAIAGDKVSSDYFDEYVPKSANNREEALVR